MARRKGREDRFTKREGIHLTPGGLEGWHANESAEQRHAALRRALRTSGSSYRRVIDRLTIIGNLNEHQSPETTRKVREDVAWFQKNFGERGY
jgi:hypothetical protein